MALTRGFVTCNGMVEGYETALCLTKWRKRTLKLEGELYIYMVDSLIKELHKSLS